MKNFVLSFLFSVLCATSSGVFAGQQVDIDSLPPDLKAQVQKQVSSDPNIGAGAPAVLREIRLMGESLGSGVAAAAEKLGVAANTFLGTGMGRIIAGMLLLKFFGGMLLKTVFVVVGWVLIPWSLRRAMWYAGYTGPQPTGYRIEQVPVLFGFWTITKRVPENFQQPRKDADNPGTVLFALFAVLTFIAWAICFANL